MAWSALVGDGGAGGAGEEGIDWAEDHCVGVDQDHLYAAQGTRGTGTVNTLRWEAVNAHFPNEEPVQSPVQSPVQFPVQSPLGIVVG